MKKGSTLFLRSVVFILGLVVLALCIIVLPATINSGHWVNYRYILFGMYVPAVPFFIALYQAVKLLDHIDKNQAFSGLSTAALKNIKYCAIAISLLYAAGMPYILYIAHKEDAPGLAALGFVIVFASVIITTFTAVLQKLLQEALNIKSENDLTV